jgi:hypothetical protein
MKLIALTGLHGAGKDTVADALPARKLAFADVLYLEVAEAFGIRLDRLKDRSTKELPLISLQIVRCADIGLLDFLPPRTDWSADRSPRQILQWWGDYRRAQDPGHFVKELRAKLSYISCQVPWPSDVVITDCRFPNEAAMVRQLGGQIWQVVRPGHEPPRTGHASETTGDEFAPEVVLVNDGSVKDLRAAALKEWNK